MNRPSLSIVLPNYNHGRFIAEALEALLAQTVPGDEIIVIDDASTDNSLAVIASFNRENPSVRLIRNVKNQGVVAGLNRGLAEAKYEYVYFAAADDRVLPKLFDRSLALLTLHLEAGLCSAMVRLIDEGGNDLGLFETPQVRRDPGFVSPAEAARALVWDDSWFMGNTTVYHRARLVTIGGFRPELESFCDGFVSRLLALRHGACFIPEPLALWRRMAGGYALQTATDMARAAAVADAAGALMTGTYAADFPPGYSTRWRGRWLFGARYLNIKVRQHQRWRRLLEGCRGLGPIGRPAERLIRTMMAAERGLIGGLLLLGYRPRDALAVARRRLGYGLGGKPQ